MDATHAYATATAWISGRLHRQPFSCGQRFGAIRHQHAGIDDSDGSHDVLVMEDR